MVNYNSSEHKRSILIRYLDGYLSKYKLNMKWIMNNIIMKLKNDGKITLKQFYSVLSFIEREPPFLNMSRDQILKHFDEIIEKEPLVKKESKNDDTNSTLEPFFT